ncbi:MAG: outer membrane protein transport protein [Syntrophaceae bacterium]|nr:outer membrane protein transport protein [Syntrophaceae bacterium]
MTIFFKSMMFIAQLPLSVFIFFQKKNLSFNKIMRLQAPFYAIGVIFAATLVFYIPHAKAAFNESMAIDTKAISLANNVTADPPGTGSIHYNPAGLSLMGDGAYISFGLIPVLMDKKGRFEKDNSRIGFHDFRGDVEEDPLAGKETKTRTGNMFIPVLNDTAEALAGPILGLSYRKPGSKWTFGYATYAQYAGGWKFEPDDPSIYGGKSVYIQHLNYAVPAVSYRINNNLSIGASFALGQTVMGISTDVRAPNEIVNITKVLGDATQNMSNPIFDLTVPFPLFGGGIGPYDYVGNLTFDIRDDFSPGYNLGVLWEPFDWVSFGLCYQSAIKSNMSGRFAWEYSEDWQRMVSWSGSTAIMQIASIIFDLPYNVEAKQTGAVNATVEFPQIVNFGIKLTPIKRLSLLGELHWAEWSSIQEDNIRFDQKIQLLQLAKFMGYTDGPYNMVLTRKFKDTLNWGVGVEYQLLDWLQLRAGYENRKSSTVDRYYDLLYALPTMHYYGAGMGIKWSDIDIDLALGYMNSKKNRVEAGSSSNFSSYVLGAGVQNPYRGLNYEEEISVYMASLKATMPLHLITDLVFDLLPIKFGSAKVKKVSDLNTPVDLSMNFIDNMRFENKYYFIENSD